MFRYERPQAGRSRQFYQLGAEFIGGFAQKKGQGYDFSHMIQQDTECISSALDSLNRVFEGQVNLQVHMNSLGHQNTVSSFNQSMLAYFEANPVRL